MWYRATYSRRTAPPTFRCRPPPGVCGRALGRQADARPASAPPGTDPARRLGMRILLTGSRGYIGSVMAPLLVEAGHDVVGLDTDFYRRSTFGPWREEIHTIEGDVRAVEASDLKGFDAVVHLAALSNDPLGDLNPGL